MYDKEIGVFAQDPLRKALPQVYAQMTEQGPSLAFSGLIQDKYAQVLAGALANNPVPALNPDGTPVKGSGSGASGSTSTSSSKTPAATSTSVPLIPGYLKAPQNGIGGWKSPTGNTNTTGTQQLHTSASGHQSLVRPDPAHISIVIRPAVAFVERVRESVPQSREDGTVVVGAFFDQGVINVPMGRY